MTKVKTPNSLSKKRRKCILKMVIKSKKDEEIYFFNCAVFSIIQAKLFLIYFYFFLNL